MLRGLSSNLNNPGPMMIRDLFNELCKANFPNYKTIMKSKMFDRKISEYKKVLSHQDISLSVKRGREPLRYGRRFEAL